MEAEVKCFFPCHPHSHNDHKLEQAREGIMLAMYYYMGALRFLISGCRVKQAMGADSFSLGLVITNDKQVRAKRIFPHLLKAKRLLLHSLDNGQSSPYLAIAAAHPHLTQSNLYHTSSFPLWAKKILPCSVAFLKFQLTQYYFFLLPKTPVVPHALSASHSEWLICPLLFV